MDAFDYDPDSDSWVGVEGSVEESLVVDTSVLGVVFREIVFEGQLLRRVAVVDVRRVE